MKRKYILPAIALFFAILCSCSANQQEAKTPDPSPSDSAEELTGNPFLDAEQTSGLAGSGSKSIRYSITVSKEDALAATSDQYSDFLEDRVKVKKGHAESYSILFGDGTGVIFFGCDPANAQYGKTDYYGGVSEAYGFIVPNDDGTYAYQEFEQ